MDGGDLNPVGWWKPGSHGFVSTLMFARRRETVPMLEPCLNTWDPWNADPREWKWNGKRTVCDHDARGREGREGKK